jgi:hypothetical protein
MFIPRNAVVQNVQQAFDTPMTPWSDPAFFQGVGQAISSVI